MHKKETAIKRKLRERNQHWLTQQYRLAKINDLPMHFCVGLSVQQADIKNGCRLQRRGILHPDWSKLEVGMGYVSVPYLGPRGKIYHYQMFLRKEDLPEDYQLLWQDRT